MYWIHQAYEPKGAELFNKLTNDERIGFVLFITRKLLIASWTESVWMQIPVLVLLACADLCEICSYYKQ
jgi:hypothetical protein